MANELQTIDGATAARVLIQGDLARLTDAQKVTYYARVCDSLGLNPLTQPFAYIVLNGKETLYAKREATEQLRKLHHVALTIVAREVVEDTYLVTARATLPDGRTDESIGAKSLTNLKGEARANAIMTAETKAKRRVTLSICGLGLLDETEVADIPPGVVARPNSSGRGPSSGLPHRREPSEPNGGDSAILQIPPPAPIPKPDPDPPPPPPPAAGTNTPITPITPITTIADELPAGWVRIVSIVEEATRNQAVLKYRIILSSGEEVSTINSWLASLAQTYHEEETPVRVTTKPTRYGTQLVALATSDPVPSESMPTADEIPF